MCKGPAGALVYLDNQGALGRKVTKSNKRGLKKGLL